MNTKVPEGYQTVMPYLILQSADAFIDFTQKVFSAELLSKHMRDETIIQHAEIKINNDSVIMVADSLEQYPPNPASFFIYVEDADKTYALALQNGAVIVSKMSDQSYGRTGGVKDVCGNTWWITTAQ